MGRKDRTGGTQGGAQAQREAAGVRARRAFDLPFQRHMGVPYADFVLNIQPDDYLQLNGRVQGLLDDAPRLQAMQVCLFWRIMAPPVVPSCWHSRPLQGLLDDAPRLQAMQVCLFWRAHMIAPPVQPMPRPCRCACSGAHTVAPPVTALMLAFADTCLPAPASTVQLGALCDPFGDLAICSIARCVARHSALHAQSASLWRA